MPSALPFLQTLGIIVRSAASFASFEAPFDTRLREETVIIVNQSQKRHLYLLVTVEEKNASNMNFAMHRCFPSVDVVFISRKPVDEEVLLAATVHRLNGKSELLERESSEFIRILTYILE